MATNARHMYNEYIPHTVWGTIVQGSVAPVGGVWPSPGWKALCRLSCREQHAVLSPHHMDKQA